VEETLGETKARFEKAWKRFYGSFRRLGMRSALVTYHVTQGRHGGWHYHCHVVVEWKEGVVGEVVHREVDVAWHRAMGVNAEQSLSVFGRRVCAAGGALGTVVAGSQMDFWEEAPGAVEVALQYAVRDVLQGVEKWIEGTKTVEDAGAFAEALSHAKLHRVYGEWRKQVGPEGSGEGTPEVAGEETIGVKKVAKKEQKVWIMVGRMDEVLWGARSGCKEARKCLCGLLGGSLNAGRVASRLRVVAKSFAS